MNPAVTALVASAAVAQDDARPGRVRLVSATLSATEVEMGETVELTVIARIPRGHMAYFPDSLGSISGMESAGPVSSAFAPIEGDSLELTLVYPLRAFGEGWLAVPLVTLVLRPGTSGEATGAGAQVGRWSDLEALDAGTLTHRPVRGSRIRVAPVLPGQPPTRRLHPSSSRRCPGGDWSPLVLGVLAGVGTLLLAAAWGQFARWRRASRADPVAETRLSPRARALAELDHVLRQRLHDAGRLEEFYTRVVRALRHYLQQAEPGYRAALTDRELEAVLVRYEEPLRAVIRRQEVVRFWVERPSAMQAETDLEVVRGWLLEHASERTSHAHERGGSP